MRDKTFRTVGATLILVALGILWIVQRDLAAPLDPEIEPNSESPSTTAGVGSQNSGSITDSTVEPIDYRVGLLGTPSTDNFWAYYGRDATVWNAYVLGATKPALYGLEPGTNQLIPDLAVADVADPVQTEVGWEINVRLAEDAEWNDGAPITSGDFVFTFNAVRELGLSGGWETAFPANLAALEAAGRRKITLVFFERPVLSEWPYGVGLAPVMPAHVWSGVVSESDNRGDLYAASGGEDVSGGPLQIVTWLEGEIQTVAHRDAGPFISTVVFEVFEDEESAVAAMIEGEIDVFLSPDGLTPAGESMLEASDDVVVESSPANSIRYLGFNLEREPMSDGAFRSALALLFDRSETASEVVPGAEPAYSLIPPANAAWFDEDSWQALAAPYARNLNPRLQTALRDLRRTGYAWEKKPRVVNGALRAGEGLTIEGVAPAPLTILTSGDKHDPARPEYARRIEQTLETLGFDVRTVETDFDTVVDLAFTPTDEGPRQYDMYLLGWTLGNPALPDFYEEFFIGNGPINSTGYDSQTFVDAWQAYRDAANSSDAAAALWEMEAILADDLPYLPLYHPTITEAYRSDRIQFGLSAVLGGLQSRIAGIGDLSRAG